MRGNMYKSPNLNDLDQLEEFVKTTSEALYNEADKFVAEFYVIRKQKLKDDHKSGDHYPPLLGCRAHPNESGPGFRIEWFKYIYYQKDGEKKAGSKYIPKGKKSTYSIQKVFDWKTKNWEKDAFKKYDPIYAQIREKSLALGELSKRIKIFKRKMEKFEIVINE
jgi:hypothetical protein